MSPLALERSQAIARAVTADLGGRGLFGVELFVRGDEVWFSEVSPRPHDTGLVTLCSQRLSEFDLHARAILEFARRRPFAPTGRERGPSTAARRSRDRLRGLSDQALRVPESDLRLFGQNQRRSRAVGMGVAPRQRRRHRRSPSARKRVRLARSSPWRLSQARRRPKRRCLPQRRMPGVTACIPLGAVRSGLQVFTVENSARVLGRVHPHPPAGSARGSLSFARVGEPISTRSPVCGHRECTEVPGCPGFDTPAGGCGCAPAPPGSGVHVTRKEFAWQPQLPISTRSSGCGGSTHPPAGVVARRLRPARVFMWLGRNSRGNRSFRFLRDHPGAGVRHTRWRGGVIQRGEPAPPPAGVVARAGSARLAGVRVAGRADERTLRFRRCRSVSGIR